MVAQLVKKFPASYGTRRFITMFIRATNGPYPEPELSSPHLTNRCLEDSFWCYPRVYN